MSTFREQSRRMALCGVLCALALVLLSMGSLIPLATFCCPILSMLCLLPVVEEYQRKTALLVYAAIALLALLLAPDKEVALLFVFLGWYPAVRPGLERRIRRRFLSTVVKLAIFAVAVSAMYALAIGVLGMTYLLSEYTAGGQLMLLVTILLGCAVWLLLDQLLQRFTLLYRKKWRGKFFRT